LGGWGGRADKLQENKNKTNNKIGGCVCGAKGGGKKKKFRNWGKEKSQKEKGECMVSAGQLGGKEKVVKGLVLSINFNLVEMGEGRGDGDKPNAWTQQRKNFTGNRGGKRPIKNPHGP